MWAVTLLLALGSLPCLPEELGHVQPPAEEAAPPPPEPAPAPPPPRATPTTEESARYRVVYSVLGQLGELHISFVNRGESVRAVGVGKGAFIGMGQFEKRVESSVEAATAGTRRWVTARVQSGKTTTDTIEQPTPGAIQILRRRTGKPDQTAGFQRARPVMDPLGFLWRLRTRPPTRAETFEVLDGRALWIITVQPARLGEVQRGRSALLVKGRAEPIYWDGERDPERTARDFNLWFDNTPHRTPLKLVMPMPLGEVRVDLMNVQRPVRAAMAGATRATP